MKLKLVISFIVFLIFSTSAFSKPRCEELLDVVYNDTIRKDVNLNTVEDQKTIGIRLEKYWTTDKEKRGSWELKTDTNGYFRVGKITKGGLSDQIMIEDVILSINGIDLRELAKDESNYMIMKSDISDLFEEDELIEFKILRQDKIATKKNTIIVNKLYKESTKPNIRNTLESFDKPAVDFYINSINVNEKKGFFDAAIEASFLENIDERFF